MAASGKLGLGRRRLFWAAAARERPFRPFNMGLCGAAAKRGGLSVCQMHTASDTKLHTGNPNDRLVWNNHGEE